MLKDLEMLYKYHGFLGPKNTKSVLLSFVK